MIQHVQGKTPHQLPPSSPLQGPSFQVVNRRLERSPSLEITGERPAPTPPPDEESPCSGSSNFMGFSPLRGDDTPTPMTTPGQMAMNLVEDSAKDLETVLNVAETEVKSLLSRIRAGEKVIAGRPPAADSSWITNDNDDNNDSDAVLHDILEEEFNHPPINTSLGDDHQRQYNMEMESMYDELSDHNNHSLPPPPRTPPRQQQPLLPPPRTPAPRKPLARIPRKPPLAPPPPPIPPRKRLSPPYPILSPPSTFRDKNKTVGTQMGPIRHANFGTQMGNDTGVHNTLNQIFHDFCTGRKNTKQATHKIMGIVHQVSKDNIR